MIFSNQFFCPIYLIILMLYYIYLYNSKLMLSLEAEQNYSINPFLDWEKMLLKQHKSKCPFEYKVR